jgi:hypothetical protein
MADTWGPGEEFLARCLAAWFDHVDSGQATDEEIRRSREFRAMLEELGANG